MRVIAFGLTVLLAPPTEAPPVARRSNDAVAPIELEPGAARFETFAHDPLGVKRVVLSNGLTVLLSENHERPEIFGAVVVRTGGKNDPPDNTGMAHYLEHMLFKGTRELGTSDWASEEPLQERIVELYDQLGRARTHAERARIHAEIGEAVKKTYVYAVPNELDTLLSEMGGTDVNAFTNEDETVYHNSFPASQVESWLKVYAHRFVDPVFRLFPTELEAVYEEKNISMDQFETNLIDRFMRQAFPTHPYGTQTVIGEVEHLKKPSLSAMRAYFDRYYVANNMALVLSGDFDSEAILPLIRAEFGAWRSGPTPEQAGGPVAPFDGVEKVRARLTPVRAGALGYRTVAEDHEDQATVAVLRQIMTNEQGSGLIDQLMDRGQVLVAGTFPADFADAGLEVAFFAPRLFTQTFRSAERHVREQYEALAKGDFDDATFESARQSVLIDTEAQWEDNEARALVMGRSFTTELGWDGYLARLEKLRTVTKEEAVAVAAKHFGGNRLQMRSRMGFPKKRKLTKPHYPTVEPTPGAESAFGKAIRKAPQPAPQLRYVDFAKDVTTREISPGVTLRHNVNPFNDRYTLSLVFGVGTHAVRELEVLQEYLLEIGAGSNGTTAFKRAFSRINTTLEIESTRDQFIVRIDGPEKNLEKALGLVGDLMRTPRLDKKALKRLRKQRVGFTRVSKRDPGFVAGALFEYVRYGEQSEFLRAYGPRGMKRLKTGDLGAAWKTVQSHGVQARYVGTLGAAAVAKHVGTLPFQAALKPAVDKVVPERKFPSRNTVYFVPRRDAIQTHVYFAVEGDPIPERERAAADAYTEYLGGGMGGVIFQEIREFRGLAYGTWGQWATDPHPDQKGWFAGYVGCQADKTFEATDLMRSLIAELPSKPERMASLRSALERSLESASPGFRELQERIEKWGWLGYDRDPRQARLAAYAKLKFEDVERFFADHVKGRPVTLMVVGDPRRVDVQRLEKYGKVVRVKQRALFSR